MKRKDILEEVAALAAIRDTLPEGEARDALTARIDSLRAAVTARTSVDFREGVRKRIDGTLPLPPGYAGVAAVIAEEIAETVGIDAETVGRIAYATNYGYGAVRKEERKRGNRLDGKR